MVTDEELAAIKALATERDISLSATAREILARALGRKRGTK